MESDAVTLRKQFWGLRVTSTKSLDMITQNYLLNTQSRPAHKNKEWKSGDVSAEYPYSRGRDFANDVQKPEEKNRTKNREIKMDDAQQLTEIAPKILHSKGRFEAFCE